MKKKMAFVDLTNFKDWPMGGMLEYELAILPYLCEHYDVDLWGFSVDGKLPEPLLINGKEYKVNVAGNCVTGRRIIPNFWRGLYFLKYKKQFYDMYDVVYCHTGSCMTAIGHIVNKSKTKLVYHQHGLSFLVDKSLIIRIQKPFYKLAQDTSQLVFVVSDPESVKTYSKIRQKASNAEYVSIVAPINLDKFDRNEICKRIESRKGNKTSIFVYTGRLISYKNPQLLVKAMALYCKNVNPVAKLRLIGSGEELEYIQQMSKDLGLNNNVEIYGAVSHDRICDLLSDADVFLTGSIGEGCSVSVIEAYASGLPVICGKVRGLEKQVIGGYTGYFVDEFTAESFYQKMVLLDKNRFKLARNCLEKAKEYDALTVSQKIIRKIDSLF